MHLFHNWKYTPAVYASIRMESIGIPLKPATRVCKKCGITQVGEVECLGLNPPEYITEWKDEVKQ